MSNNIEEKTEMEKAKEIVNRAAEESDKIAKEKNWNVGFDDAMVDTPNPTPVVRFLKKKATVGDSLKAEDLARRAYGGGSTEFVPTNSQLMICRLSVMCTFDGKQIPPMDIERLDEDFFQHCLLKLAKNQ